MPLVVKPNVRRMRWMRDSPSEDMVHGRPIVQRLRWERIVLTAGLAAVALIGLIVLALHH
jgi:hypothetical protein